MKLDFFWTQKSLDRNVLTEKYEPIQPFLFLQLLEDANCEIIMDIGANIGFYSVIGSLLPKVKAIHSYEAVMETFKALKCNVAMNNLSERIHCHNIGISDCSTMLDFLISDTPLSGINSSKDSSIHNQKLFGSVRKVPAEPLDKLFDMRGKNLGMKIDVEGHEDYVIRGANKLLQNNQCILQIECYWSKKADIGNQLQKLGYRLFFEIENDFTSVTFRFWLIPDML
jgi:FkbM family methyltransferase